MEIPVTWHNIVAWGWLADMAASFKKGQTVAIDGRIENRQWKAQDGSKRYRSEVMPLLGSLPRPIGRNAALSRPLNVRALAEGRRDYRLRQAHGKRTYGEADEREIPQLR
jgi:hypothetical protein